MAFMMPVMKNNYDIYKDNRSRKTSECSNASTNIASALGTPGSNPRRQRKVSECKSESFATSPMRSKSSAAGGSAAYRMQMQRCQSTRAIPRNGSRSSHSSIMMSPTRSFCQTPAAAAGDASAVGIATASASASASATASRNTSPPKIIGRSNSSSKGNKSEQNDIAKFHMRLVDKLRKSFRKDNAKRS